MNIIDKMVSSVSPERGVRRAVARQKLEVLNTGYGNHGASRTKKSLIGWLFRGGSPDKDIGDNLDVLRQRSRDLYMGAAPLATSAIRTTRTNVVGNGLRLKPAFDLDVLRLSEDQAQKLKRKIEREWALWADSVECDAYRRDNFYELQQLAILSQLMSGDVFALLPIKQRRFSVYDLRIRLIEADRCCSPEIMPPGSNIRNGVELEADGEVVAYWFVNKHPLGDGMPYQVKKEWVRVEAFGSRTGRRNVLHLMESERPEQRRGVPILAPVIEALRQLGRYTEAELMAAVVSGMFTVFIETEAQDMPPVGETIPEQQQVDADDPISYELGNGAIVGLAPGEKAHDMNPARPNDKFDGFVLAILRQVGAALEIPFELLIKHFTSSYSASRAALLEAWKMFRMRRTWLANDFCQPIYEEWFAEAVAKGRIPAPGFFSDPIIRKAYTGAEWHGPAPGQIDPLKEVKAAKIRVDEGFSTLERETAEMSGGDWERNHQQRVREHTAREAAGLKGGEAGNDSLESDADGEGQGTGDDLRPD